MLSRRQIEIILKINEYNGEFVKAKDLVDFFHISARTLYNELAEIKKNLDESVVVLESVRSKGYRIRIINFESYGNFVNEKLKILSTRFDMSDPLSRQDFILTKLLSTKKKYLTNDDFADEMFISKSTLALDIKNVRKTLDKYNLKLKYHFNKGLTIHGKEINIRALILKENIGVFHHQNNYCFRDAREVVENVLFDEKFLIGDNILQSFIIHVELALKRMMLFRYVSPDEIEYIPTDCSEYNISKKIVKKLAYKFNTEVCDAEIRYLAIYLLGKKNCGEKEVISEEINNFIVDELIKIKQEFSIDLVNNLNLRISLALHLLPMIRRLKYNMQLKNVLTLVYKQNYPLAYDLATSIARGINSVYGYKVEDDEIAYLAIHINLCIENDKDNSEARR